MFKWCFRNDESVETSRHAWVDLCGEDSQQGAPFLHRRHLEAHDEDSTRFDEYNESVCEERQRSVCDMQEENELEAQQTIAHDALDRQSVNDGEILFNQSDQTEEVHDISIDHTVESQPTVDSSSVQSTGQENTELEHTSEMPQLEMLSSENSVEKSDSLSLNYQKGLDQEVNASELDTVLQISATSSLNACAEGNSPSPSEEYQNDLERKDCTGNDPLLQPDSSRSDASRHTEESRETVDEEGELSEMDTILQIALPEPEISASEADASSRDELKDCARSTRPVQSDLLSQTQMKSSEHLVSESNVSSEVLEDQEDSHEKRELSESDTFSQTAVPHIMQMTIPMSETSVTDDSASTLQYNYHDDQRVSHEIPEAPLLESASTLMAAEKREECFLDKDSIPSYADRIPRTLFIESNICPEIDQINTDEKLEGACKIRERPNSMSTQSIASSQADEKCFDREELELKSNSVINTISDESAISAMESTLASWAEEECRNKEQTWHEQGVEDDYIFQAFTLLDLSVSSESASLSQTEEDLEDAGMKQNAEAVQVVALKNLMNSSQCDEQQFSLPETEHVNEAVGGRRRINSEGRQSTWIRASSKVEDKIGQLGTEFSLDVACSDKEERKLKHSNEPDANVLTKSDLEAGQDKAELIHLVGVKHVEKSAVLEKSSSELSILVQSVHSMAEETAEKEHINNGELNVLHEAVPTLSTLNKEHEKAHSSNVLQLSSREDQVDDNVVDSSNIAKCKSCQGMPESVDTKESPLKRQSHPDAFLSTPTPIKENIRGKAVDTPDTHGLSFSSAEDECSVFKAVHEEVEDDANHYHGSSTKHLPTFSATESLSLVTKNSVRLLIISSELMIAGVLLVGLWFFLRDDRGLRNATILNSMYNPAGVY